MADIKWRPSTRHAQATTATWRPIYLKLVLKSWWGKVTRRYGPAWWRGERIVVGVRTGWLRVEGLRWRARLVGRSLAASTISVLSRGAVVGRFLVTFLLQAGDEALNDVDLEQAGEVGYARGRNEDVLEGGRKVGAILGACDRVEFDAKREGGLGNVVAGAELEAVDIVCADGEATDFGLGA